MKTYTPEELQAILAKHKAWLNNEPGGERANLSDANLRGANLSDANLSGAKLGFNCNFAGSCGAPIYQACRGFGSRDAALTLLAIGEPEKWRFFTGCFRGTRSDLEKAIAKKYGETKEQENYLRAIEYLWQTALSNR